MPSLGLPGFRVLIIEDEPLIAHLLMDQLRELGCGSIEIAGTVHDALEKVMTFSFDCAILDINLQGQSSEAVARLLVEKEKPFVIATGYYEAPPGFPPAPMLKKPYQVDKLMMALSQAALGT